MYIAEEAGVDKTSTPCKLTTVTWNSSIYNIYIYIYDKVEQKMLKESNTYLLKMKYLIGALNSFLAIFFLFVYIPI